MTDLVLFNTVSSSASAVSTDTSLWERLDFITQYLFNEIFGPLFDNIKGFLDFASDILPVDMVIMCLSGLSTLLILRILHGASSGG